MLERPIYQPLLRVAEFLDLRVLALPRVPGNGFRVDLADVETGLAKGARAIVVTNLHNPSGHYSPPDRLERLAACCARAAATVIVDEVYLDAAFLTRGGERWTAASVSDNIVATSSLTKIYGLGGLRTGWLIAPLPVAERAREITDLLSVENAAPASELAAYALSRIGVLEDRYRQCHKAGQEVVRRWLEGEPRVQGYPNCGALFELMRLPPEVDSTAFCEALCTKYDTQVVDGRFFELPGHVRVSTAGPAEELAEGLGQISAALDERTASSHTP
jgi:hypothetical protein